MTHQFEQLEKNQDIRVAATSKIWGLATGMLAICIPLSAVTNSGSVLPIAVISGAAVSTTVIWKSEDKKSQASPLLPSNLNQLEQRVANLETIICKQD